MAHAVVVPVVGGNPLSRQRPTAMARHGNLSVNYSDRIVQGGVRFTPRCPERLGLAVEDFALITGRASLGLVVRERGVALPLAADHDVGDPQAVSSTAKSAFRPGRRRPSRHNPSARAGVVAVIRTAAPSDSSEGGAELTGRGAEEALVHCHGAAGDAGPSLHARGRFDDFHLERAKPTQSWSTAK